MVVLVCYSCHNNSPNVHSSKPNWKMSPFGLLFDTKFISLAQTHITFQKQRLLTMSVSLHTQTGSPSLTIQIINTRVCFISIWCASLTSVHYNLEHGLVTVVESISPLNLDDITSFFKDWTRSDTTSHTIPDTIHLPCTLNWLELATAN